MIFNKLGLHEALAFIVGASIGILILYLYKPPPQIIIKHPTPHNVDTVIYNNKSGGGCYKYIANEVKCDSVGVILDHPIMILE